MDRPDLVAELAELLKEAGLTPTLYARPVDLVAFRDELRGELDREFASAGLRGQLIAEGNRRALTEATGRAVARHLVRLDRLALLAALACDHSSMAECHPGCGHFVCGCGLSWDEGAGR